MSSPQRKIPRLRRLPRPNQQPEQTDRPRTETTRDDVDISTDESEPVGENDQLSDDSLQALLNSIAAEFELAGSVVRRAHRERKRPFSLSTISEESGQDEDAEAAVALSASTPSLQDIPLVEPVEIYSPQTRSHSRRILFRPSECLTSKDETSSHSSSLDENSPTYAIKLFRRNVELLTTQDSLVQSPRTPEEQKIIDDSGDKSELALTEPVSKIRHRSRSRTSLIVSLSPEQSASADLPSSTRGSGDSSEGTSSLVNFLLNLPSDTVPARHEEQQTSPVDFQDDLISDPRPQVSFSPRRKTGSARRSSQRLFHSSAQGLSARALVSGIDPILVGPNVVQTVLHEDQILRHDEEVVKKRSRCSCDVKKHPRSWSRELIIDVHSYSFLLLTQDLEMERERIILWTGLVPGMVMYNVRMIHGDSWKRKAEQVLKYIDVELSIGDQSIYDTWHYIQPLDRKIVLMVMKDKIIGLVVAEKIDKAYKVLLETRTYRELDLNSAVQVKVGINQLWVHCSLRRNKLATQLCELIRKQFFPNEILQVEDLAFNNNSEMGLKFAKYYLNIKHNSNNKVLLYMGKAGRMI